MCSLGYAFFILGTGGKEEQMKKMMKNRILNMRRIALAIFASLPFMATAHWVSVVSDDDAYNQAGYNYAILRVDGGADVETVYFGSSIEVPDHAVVAVESVLIEGGAVTWDGSYSVNQGSLTNVVCDITVTVHAGERQDMGQYISGFTLDSAERGASTDAVVLVGTITSPFGAANGRDADTTISLMELRLDVFGRSSPTGTITSLATVEHPDFAGVDTNRWTATIAGAGYSQFRVQLSSGVFSGNLNSGFVSMPSSSGIEWDYVITNGVAVIGRGNYNTQAIPKSVSGAIEIPTELDGNPVGAIASWAFRGCTNLTSIVIPSCVTNIGAGAFEDCKSLNAISMPSTVKGVYSRLFSGCSSLVELMIPEGVERVGNNVIQDCTSLKRLVLPTTLRSAADSAFAYAPALEEVVGLDNVADGCYMSYSVFAGNSSLKRIDLSRISISDGVGFLQGCTSLGDVVIPTRGWRIGDWAFAGCSSLTNVVGAWRIGSIGQGSFVDCSSLETYTIYGEGSQPPAEVSNGSFCVCASIGTNAFANCTNMVRVSFKGIPIGSTAEYGFVADSAFDGCPLATGYYSPSYSNEWAAAIDAFSGKWHGLAMQMGNPEPVSFIIRDGVIVGFSGDCPASLEIPEEVKSIGAHVFENCRALREVTIPDSVTNIGEYAFSYCTNLTSVTIPTSVLSINGCAFRGCSALSNIIFEGELASIEMNIESALGETPWYAGYLENLPAREPVFTIDNGVLKAVELNGCTCAVIPETVTRIDENVFGNCTRLTSIYIPHTVTNIGANAFVGCTNLSSLHIEEMSAWCNMVLGDGRPSYAGFRANPLRVGVSSGVSLYLNGEIVRDLEIPEGVTNISFGVFVRGTFESVHFPSSLISIGDYAFYDCGGIGELVFNGNLHSIGEFSFAGCTNATSALIPSSLRRIDDFAFHRCESLVVVNVENLESWFQIQFGDSWSNPMELANSFCLNGVLVDYDIEIPSGITEIGFMQCACLHWVKRWDIPEGVERIGSHAFSRCHNLGEVTFPKTLSDISGHWVFGHCEALTNLVFLGNAPTVNNASVAHGDVFGGISSNCIVKVRRSSTGWGVDIPGVWNGMRIEYLPESTGRTVSCSTTGDETSFNEGDSIPFAVALSEPNGADSPLYAYLLCESASLAASFAGDCMISDAASASSARGLSIWTGMTSATGCLFAADNTDSRGCDFSIVLCTTATYDPSHCVMSYGRGDAMHIVVNNVAPVVVQPSDGTYGSVAATCRVPLSFTWRADDVNADVTNGLLIDVRTSDGYAWTTTNNSGSGTCEIMFSQPGNQTVTLTVTDKDGGMTSVRQYYNVAAPPSPGEELVDAFDNFGSDGEPDGTVTIGEYTGGWTNHFVIPETVDGKAVVAIGDDFAQFSSRTDADTFFYVPQMSMVTVPASVLAIGVRAFGSSNTLRHWFEQYGVAPAMCPIMGIRFLGDAPVYGRYESGAIRPDEVGSDCWQYPFPLQARIFVPREYQANWTRFLAQFGMEIAGFIGEDSDGNGVTCRTWIAGKPWAYTITNGMAHVSRWYAYNGDGTSSQYPSCMAESGTRIMRNPKLCAYSLPAVLPSTEGEVVVPDEIDGYVVTGIDDAAFAGCRGITGIRLPETVRAIGRAAFAGCRFEVFSMPTNVTTIGDCAFSFCTSLVSVALSPNLESIGKMTFASCRSLAEISLPQCVTNLDALAFADCESLTNVTLNACLERIGHSAFAGCTALKGISIPASVGIIGDSAFADCTGLKEVAVAGMPASIGGHAFARCSALDSVSFASGDGGEGLIGMFAFEDCVSLRALKIPAWVRSIDWGVFAGCERLTCVYYEGFKGRALPAVPAEVAPDGGGGIYDGANEHLVSYFTDQVWRQIMHPSQQTVVWQCRNAALWPDYPNAPVRRAVEFHPRHYGCVEGGLVGVPVTRYVASKDEIVEPFVGAVSGASFVGWEIDYSNFKGVLKLAARYNGADGSEIADFYVRADGDDANDGRTRETAFRTIRSALVAAFQSGYNDLLILVGDGIYPAVEFETQTNYEEKPLNVTIRSENGAANTVISGGGTNRCVTLQDADGRHTDVNFNGFVFKGFTFRDGISSASWWMWRDNAEGTPGGVWGGTYVDCIISNCVMRGAGDVADYGAGARDAVLVNTLLVNNSHSNGTCKGVAAAGCELYNCTVAGAEAESPQLYGCLAYNTIVAASAPSEESVLVFCFVGDAKFVDAAHGDYRLAHGSPCIDAGDSDLVVSVHDIAGLPRISGEAVDVGCHELRPALSLSPMTATVAENAVDGVRIRLVRTGSVARECMVDVEFDAAQISAPSTVTIPAGSVSTIFTVAPIDNAVADGTRVVSVSVSADGFTGSFVPLTILDDEVPKLTVTLDKTSIREGDGTITATVTREGAKDAPLTVYLSGSSGNRVSYPSSVVIPAGAASVTFEISVPDNDVAQVASDLTLRASSSGYQSAAVSYAVEDDDVPGVVLTIAPEVVQEGGAVRATLMRTDTENQSKAITVRLSASNPNEIASMPSSVTIPARTSGRSFYIYVADDGLDNGDREITINGAIVIESCGCDGQPSSGDAITATLGVIDNDGPALSLNADPAMMKEGLATAGHLVISHNSTLTEDLAVRIWVDAENLDEVEIPEVVTIPAGETSVRIPVKTLDDGVEDGSKIVSVYAEVDDDAFAPASTWVLVTDQNLPDLVPADVVPQYAAVTAGEKIALSFAVTNAGFMVTKGAVRYSIYCVKGTSGTVEGPGTLLVSGATDSTVSAGGAAKLSVIVTVPDMTGDCRFAVVVDPDDAILELDNANNTMYSPVVSVSPSYIAEANVAEEMFLQGTEIAITGAAVKADGMTPAANVEIEVYILKDSLRRTLTATTDAQGRFSAIFRPTTSEAGHYTVGASFPGMGASAEQDSFDIIGMKRASSEYMTWYMTVGDEKTLTTSIANLSPVALTGVEVEIVGASQECSVKASIAGTIAGNARASLSVSVSATGVSGGNDYKAFAARIVSQEGATLEVPLYFYAKSPKALLKASPVPLEATMTTGAVQTVAFTVSNTGMADSGRLEVLLPKLPWMRVVSGGEAANLSGGESMTVQLELAPGRDLALNYTYTPTIAVNCENGNGIVMPCRFTPVAGASGGVRLSVMEKYSLTAGYAMPVSNTTIQVKNKYTGEVVASGSCSPNGSWEADGIAAGEWAIYVTAPHHAAYADEITVQAERTAEKTVLMDTEAVSVYWKEFRRVDVEDETDIDLVCEYVTTVPQPVVVIKGCPDEIPQLEEGGSTAFNIVAVNEGWIAAQDAHLDLPELEGYEWTAQQDIGLVPAGASVTVPVMLTRKKTEPVRTRLLAAKSPTKVICKFVLQIGYFWDCGWDRKWAAYPKLMKFKACFYETDVEKVPKPPSSPDPKPVPPRLPGESGGSTSPGGGGDPTTVVLGENCNPCVMGRGYALIDAITDFFTGITSHDITDEDVRNLKEMGLPDDSDLMETLRYFGYGKNLDTKKSVGEYTKEMAADAMKGVLKYGAKLNKIMVIVGKENNWTNPRWSPTLAKIGEATKAIAFLKKALKVLKLTEDSLDALLGPESCAHLNLPPLIDSDGNINEELAELVEKRYEFAWEETAASTAATIATAAIGRRGSADRNAFALMNPDVPESLWSGLLKFETYRLQVGAYGNLLKELFPTNTIIGDPSFGQVAECMEVVGRHIEASNLSMIDATEFSDADWDDEDEFSQDQIVAFVSNWNAGVAAYESGAMQPEGADVEVILRNYRIMAQTENIARSLGYWSVGHMVAEEKPLLLEAIDKESGSVCASVKLKISQTARMTREAFEGVLEIGNSSAASPITDIRLIPIITDDSGAVSTNLFAFSQIGSENLSGGSILAGGMALGAAQTGTATIRFVPSADAAPIAPKTYRFGGLLSYVNPFTGIQETKEIIPVTMTVNPSPRLAFDYFVQRDVIGDDPFTVDIVEPSVPAEIALVIRNNGYGDASNVTIKSVAPQIVENTKGLLADFTLSTERSALNGESANIGLSDVYVGTIPAKGQAVAQWWLTCSIQGHFRNFDASFTHRTSYGETSANMSLVESVTVHPLVRSIDADGDSLPDFLVSEYGANGTPDMIFAGTGGEENVVSASGAECDAPDGSFAMRLTVFPRIAGWNYAACADRGNGRFEIAKVVRDDGTEIPLQNVWFTDRTFIGEGDPKKENKIHIIDRFSSLGEVSYTLHLTPMVENPLQVASFGGIEDGSVVKTMPDALVVTFTRPITHETFDRTDITLRRQGTRIEDLDSISITRIDDDGLVYSISGLRGAFISDGTYTLTVQTAHIADDAGDTGISGKSIMWTVLGGEAAPPTVSALGITPDCGFSDGDGVTFGSDFTLNGSVDRAGVTVQVLARRQGVSDFEVWNGVVSGKTFSIPVRLTTGGSVTLVLGVADDSGNTSETLLPIFIDTVPLVGSLTGASEDEDVATASATLTFSDRVMDGDVTLEKFALTRDGEAVSLEGVTLAARSASAPCQWELSGLDALCAEDGVYVLTFNGAAVRKYTSGLPMSGLPVMRWRYENPDREPPTVAEVLFDGETPHEAYTNVFSSVSVTFGEAVNVPELIANGLIGRAARIDLLDAAGTVTGCVAAVRRDGDIAPYQWDGESNSLSWQIDPLAVPAGRTRLILDAGLIADLAGNHLAADGCAAADGMRTYALAETVLAQVNAQAMPMWHNGELYVGEKTADNKGKIRHYAANGTWTYLQSEGVDIEIPGSSIAGVGKWEEAVLG